MKALIQCAGIALAALVATGNTVAQTYPTRPITVVIPNVPGSPYEAAVRYVNAELAKRLGQPIVVEYKPGAGQLIGANYVRNAKPDGYTLLYGSVLGIHPLFVKNNPVDAAKDLSPISSYAFTPYFIFSGTRIKSFQELRAYSKANPDQLKWATVSSGTTLFLARVQQKAGLSGEFIPYKSSPDAVNALIRGDIDVAPGTTTTVSGLVQSGRINALLVTAMKRSAVLPDVPSAAELGLPDLGSLGFSQGLWGPPGLPKEIAQRLSTEVAAILKTPEAQKYLVNATGADVLGTTPEEQVRMFEAEIKGLAETAKAINFKPE